MVNHKLLLNTLLVVCIPVLSYWWISGGLESQVWKVLIYASLIGSFLILLRKGANELTPAFWFVVLAAYPIAGPILSMDLLGYEFYSSGDKHHQTWSAILGPAVFGAMGTLFLANNLNTDVISVPRSFRSKTTWPPGVILAFFSAGCVVLMASSYLDAPPSMMRLGDVAYSELKDLRDQDLNAASGLVIASAAFSALCLIVIRSHPRIGPTIRLVATALFITITIGVSTMQLLSASRIEVIGILFFLLLVFGDQVRPLYRRTSILLLLLILSIIGYTRTLATIGDHMARTFLTLPGGVENTFNTYVFGLNTLRDGFLNLQFGQTYLDLLARLPPRVFGFERPPRIYDLLLERTRLIGGEYFLTEATVNFLGLGVIMFLCITCWLYNASIRNIRLFYSQQNNLFSALLSATLVMVSFRFFWYSIEHALKTLIVATIIGLPIYLVSRNHNNRQEVSKPVAHLS